MTPTISDDRNVFKRLAATNASRLQMLLRIMFAVVILPNGAQKLFGWFGGFGFSGTMDFFTTTIGIPWILGFLIIITETLGMAALLFGFMGRILAAAMIIVMVGAMVTVHAKFGMMMNWFGAQAGEGIQFHLLVITLAIVILVRGSGAFSIDRTIAGRER